MGFPALVALYDEKEKHEFQSLIGIYGFSGALGLLVVLAIVEFQSLIGIYGFSGKNQGTTGKPASPKFQSLIGIYGFSGFDCRYPALTFLD